MKRADRSTQAIYVGADQLLGDEICEIVGSKVGTIQRFVDLDVAANLIDGQSVDIAIVHVSDATSHARLLDYLRSEPNGTTSVIVVHDRLEPEQLLDLYQAGATECLGRPLNLSRLSLVWDLLMATKLKSLPAEEPQAAIGGWHGKLMEQVRAVAPLNTTVLVTGETGTGKTRLSRIVHSLSGRHEPFLAINCGALSESLIDSELFGHVKGAFTGADRNYVGKLAQCREGTLLLDEIDTLSLLGQVKLLQVVEDRVFQPVGSTEFQPLQARLIVASNKPLEQEVAKGRFRSDLFYRLNVMSFHLQPLRERREEIKALADKFSTEFATQHGFAEASFAQRTLDAFNSYEWPGNIRELRNVIERAVILAAGQTIEPKHLPHHIGDSLRQAVSAEVGGGSNKLVTARLQGEREQLIDSLERNDNNRSKTAMELGISRAALYKRLHKLQIL